MQTDQKCSPCAYCDEGNGAETKDHIPPKSCFPADRREDIISVPACKTCNNEASKDDEYFRLMMSSRGEANDQESAKAVIEKSIRGLNKPEAAGFAKLIASQMKLGEAVSAGGIHLGEQLVVEADYQRISQVVERIGRGFYFLEKGVRLPDTHEIHVLLLQQQMLEGDLPLQQAICHFKTENFVKIGDGVFSYAYLSSCGDDKLCDSWIFDFYETTCFLVVVSKRADGEP